MDFEFTHEQRLLSTVLDRALGGCAPGQAWHALAELGALGACLPEEDGGSGGGGVEMMVVMQALGRAACTAPYLAAVAMGGIAVAAAGSAAQRAKILPSVIEGTSVLAFAHAEPQSRFRLAHVITRAVAGGKGFVLSGCKGLVTQGQHAHLFVVSARVSGNAEDRDGIGLFLVDATATGLHKQDVMTQDGQGAAMLHLDGVQIAADRALGSPGDAWPVIARVLDQAIAAICAEALGAMEEACRLTLDYLGTRQQFGQKIGSFQALQHRAVDMFVALELARSMVMYAAVMADEADADSRARAMSAVKIRVARSARLIAQEAIQLHGAIGLTEEYALGAHARRLAMIEIQFGDVDHHARRLAA